MEEVFGTNAGGMLARLESLGVEMTSRWYDRETGRTYARDDDRSDAVEFSPIWPVDDLRTPDGRVVAAARKAWEGNARFRSWLELAYFLAVEQP